MPLAATRAGLSQGVAVAVRVVTSSLLANTATTHGHILQRQILDRHFCQAINQIRIATSIAPHVLEEDIPEGWGGGLVRGLDPLCVVHRDLHSQQ